MSQIDHRMVVIDVCRAPASEAAWFRWRCPYGCRTGSCWSR